VTTQIRAPTSDDSVAGTWTGTAGTRYQAVDDYPDTTPADYLEHGTVAGNIAFGFAAFNISAGSTGISVQVQYYDAEPAAGTNRSYARLKVGGNYYNHGSYHNPAGTTYTAREYGWATNPKTGLDWTVDDINGVGANALQAFGLYTSDANPKWRVSCIQLQVTYTPPAAGGSATVSGGGVVSGTGRKAGASSVGVTGAGIPAAAGTKGGLGIAAVSGGGAVTATGSAIEAKEGVAAVNGGGVVAVVGAKAARAPPVGIVAGGSIAIAGAKSAGVDSATSGAGTVAAQGATQRQGQPVATGGGTIAVSGRKATQGQAAVAGSGQTQVVGAKAAAGTSVVSGGGEVIATGASGTVPITGQASVSGGGASLATGAKATTGQANVSGGGGIVGRGWAQSVRPAQGEIVTGEWANGQVEAQVDAQAEISVSMQVSTELEVLAMANGEVEVGVSEWRAT